MNTQALTMCAAACVLLTACASGQKAPVPDPVSRVLISGAPAPTPLVSGNVEQKKTRMASGKVTQLPSLAEAAEQPIVDAQPANAVEGLALAIKPKAEQPPSPAVATAELPVIRAALPVSNSLEQALATKKTEVRFAFAMSEVGPKGKRELSEIAPLAKRARSITLIGATDQTGDPKANQVLALARAHSVAKLLADNGVSQHTILAKACTAGCIASADHAANRRVDIEIVVPIAALAAYEPRRQLVAMR